jgi:YidC/Oxa1 family membrane protein insertase
MTTNMMNYLRYFLYALLVFIGLQVYQDWDKEHPKPTTLTQTTAATTTPSAAATPTQSASNSYVPSVPATGAPAANPESNPASVAAATPLIHVKTDLMNVDISTTGGDIDQVSLLKYPQELHSTEPFLFLNNAPDTRYIAQSGLLSANGPDSSKGQAIYTADQTDYTLVDGQNDMQVKLHWQQNGLDVTKTYTFKRNSYEIDVAYQLDNKSSAAWTGNLYLQLMRKNTPPATSKGIVSLATFFGAAVSSPDKPFLKIPFKNMIENNYAQNITGGWAAMVQHYFVSAWVPEETAKSDYFSKVTNDGLFTIGMVGPLLTANPGATVATQAKFYAGPAIADNLMQVSPKLPLTIDYGVVSLIAMVIFWMLQKIHSIVGNWGWSIVLVTIVIKLIFYRLSAKSYRSMNALKKLQPKINQLKERMGDDKAKFTQATIDLYKKEKVNPMSGCLPILIQIPVFISLYWVLIESVQLRQAPWILWIHDLTQKDPFYILPVLMGISMFLQQRLNPPPPDPTQAKIMMFMPVVFTAMFLNFPAGLMLYWFVNNSLSFLQQWYIMRSMNNEVEPKQKFIPKTK